MQIGIHYTAFPETPGRSRAATLAETVRVADEGGVEQFSLMDHYFQMEMLGGPEEPMLEGYTTLGFLAGQTSRVRLGLLVTGVAYRHPGLLAKIVSTLDVLSEGRAQLGIGAAWYEREARGLGVPFPPRAERYERLEETLQICRAMWAGTGGAFDGRHYRLEEMVCEPPPLQGAALPVMIGGSGERKTLRLVAEHADACNLFDGEPEVLRHKLEVLQQHCADVGRDGTAIRRTVLHNGDPVTDPDGFRRRVEQYADLGFSLVVVMPPTGPGADPVAWTERVVGEVLPAVREL